MSWKVVAIATVLVVLVALGIGVVLLPDTALRAWSCLSVILIPLSLATGWFLGQIYAKGFTRGIGLGVDRVSRAASDVSTLRAGDALRAVGMARQASPQQAAPLHLPDPQVRFRDDGAGEIIEL